MAIMGQRELGWEETHSDKKLNFWIDIIFAQNPIISAKRFLIKLHCCDHHCCFNSFLPFYYTFQVIYYVSLFHNCLIFPSHSFFFKKYFFFFRSFFQFSFSSVCVLQQHKSTLRHTQKDRQRERERERLAIATKATNHWGSDKSCQSEAITQTSETISSS